MQLYKDFLGFGIAGNFALHLAQAGELEDFKDVITADEAAPKGLFPFYLPALPKSKSERPHAILGTYPLASQQLQLPKEDVNVQAEPEVALLCDIMYENDKVTQIVPKKFAAYNDASIRVAGAEKISDKKNWGSNSKGIAKNLLNIDTFSDSGIMDNFSICSFLRRNNNLTQYGEDVKLSGYSYFYDKLTAWIVNQINTQEDFGPLEDIKSYVKACNNPTKLMISIGATRYTPFGESTFLQAGDEVLVVLYDKTRYELKDVIATLEAKEYDKENMTVLAQEVLSHP